MVPASCDSSTSREGQGGEPLDLLGRDRPVRPPRHPSWRAFWNSFAKSVSTLGRGGGIRAESQGPWGPLRCASRAAGDGGAAEGRAFRQRVLDDDVLDAGLAEAAGGGSLACADV